MALREEFEKTGQELFKQRSYLPMLFFPVVLLALPQSNAVAERLGFWPDVFFKCFSLAVSLSGIAVRCFTVGYTPKGTSGRNTDKQIAEVLNTTGIYSFVRHPLYLGNFLIFLGSLLYTQVWWLVLLGTTAFWIYYERIMFAEEEFLRRKFGDAYVAWSADTPAFCPKMASWRKPPLPFSWKKVIRKEYTGFYVIVFSFSLLEILCDYFSLGSWQATPHWMAFFGGGTFIYFAVMALKKWTPLLSVPDR